MLAWLAARLTAPLLSALAGAAVLASAYGAGWMRAEQHYTAQADAEREKRYAAVAQAVVEQYTASAALELKLARTISETRIVYRELKNEVPVFVTPIGRRGCVVPRGFVWLHNLSAGGHSEFPAGASELVDAPSGIGLDSVASTVVENYGLCREWREQVNGWQRWYQESQKHWSGAHAME